MRTYPKTVAQTSCLREDYGTGILPVDPTGWKPVPKGFWLES